jgi:hypothetical protein
MKIMDDVINNRRKLPKKDFANYTSYEELLKDLSKIKQESRSEDVTKIYEDKDLLVMAANTWDASCKYGAGTKWCTTARDTDSYWRRHNETGTEFFWIFKNKPQDDPNHKFSYHIRLQGNPDWCNAVNNCRPELPENSYPKQHPMYDEIISKLRDFHNQRDLVKISSEREANREETVNWVRNNIVNILNVLNIEQDYRFALDGVIEDFIYSEVDYVEPFNGDLDDIDYVENFRSDLVNHLESFNPPFNLTNFISGSEIITDLGYVINEIPNVQQHISDGSIMDILTPDFTLQYGFGEHGSILDEVFEVVSENLNIYSINLIEDEVRNFALSY